MKPDDSYKVVLRTYNEELDRRLGGIPLPSVTLIEGPNDSGKSVLLYHLIHGCLKLGLRTCLLSSEGGGKVIVESVENLGLDLKRGFLMGELVVVQLGANRGDLAEEEEKRWMLHSLLDYFNRKREKFKVFAIDSLTALTIGLVDADLLEFFSRLREMRERDGLSFFVTVHTYSFTQELLIRIRAMADTHLSLSIREVSGQLLKTLQVLKIRGASKSTGDVITFEVEPGFGIKVLPYTQVKV
jgi:flagellar protein FlaH